MHFLEEERDTNCKWSKINRRTGLKHLHRGVADIDAKRIMVGNAAEEVNCHITAIKVFCEIFTFVASVILIDTLERSVGIEIEDWTNFKLEP